MAVSGNGWPVSPSATELGLETFTVGNASFSVRGGKVRQALEYVITQVHNRVEKANAAYGCYGHSYRMNVNSPGTWSNHASGTALDFNATLHGNGIPTAATFTAAQIAEIHTILAEVHGVVRWGGDYNGTPDAMHFEINVGPEALDVVIDENAIPDNGQIKPIGAPTLEFPSKIPYLTENSVSYPTLMNYGHGFAQWKFSPQQTGTISIDALLSHYSDPAVEAQSAQGPLINLYIFEIAYTSTGAIVPKFATEVAASPGTQFGRLAGQMNVPVVAGKHYIIRTTCTPAFPWIRAVVRIGTYARVSDWITPPEVEAVVTIRSRTLGGSVKSIWFPSAMDSGSGPDWIYENGEPGWLYGGMQKGPRLINSYSVRTSAFGRAPWALSTGTEAMECAWRWARRFSDDQDWSPAEGISWYGVPLSELSFPDVIYPANGAGSGTCWFHSDMEQAHKEIYEITDAIGIRYEASSPLISWDGEAHRAALFGQFTHGNVTWKVYGGSIVVDFDAIRYSAGASGWGGAWIGPSYSGSNDEGYRPMYMDDEIFNGDYFTSATAEWEDPDTMAKIVAVDWALDEYSFQRRRRLDDEQLPEPGEVGSVSGALYDTYPLDNKVDTVCEWYVQRIDPAENVEGYTFTDYREPGAHPYGQWGPWGNDEWYSQAPGDGPASLAASSQHLTTTGGGTTSPWAPLDSSYWSLANEREIDFYQAYYIGYVDLKEELLPAVPAQIRFVALPRAIFSDSMPFIPPSGYGEGQDAGTGNDDGDTHRWGIIMDDYLQGQSIAIKVTVQPGRYRIVYQPTIPDITYSGGPSIDLAPDDAGRVLY